MSYSADHYVKLGAYASPFSGQGVPFYPLGVKPEDALLLHEAGYVAARPHWNYPRVFSPFWRLYYDFESGHRVVFPDTGTTVKLGPEHIMLIPDHQMFHTEGHEPRAKFWIHFTCPRRVHPNQALPILLRPTACELGVLREEVHLLKSRNSEALKNRILHVGLALLHLTLGRTEIRWLEEKPAGLVKLLSFMEQHYREPLPNTVLAHRSGVSERSLTRLFLRYQGVSPRQFLMQVRVREAANLMLTSPASLAEVAERTGFPNRAYLTRVFTQVTGKPPALFRRTHPLP